MVIVMKYRNIQTAVFIARPNRFIAEVEVDGKTETVHVKNTGRCRELLLPGSKVILEKSDNSARNTQYDLVSVNKKDMGWINIDSQACNVIAREWLDRQDYDYIKPYIAHNGARVNTGIKYHRITGKTEFKDYYNIQWAKDSAERQAGHFLNSRTEQIADIADYMDKPPIILCPYDAELYGHWWYEGPYWLYILFKKIYYDECNFELITPSEYIDKYPEIQECAPCRSSWGANGYSGVWLNSTNDYVHRHLHKAGERMIELASMFPNAKEIVKDALNQAARELLLAQTSCWLFIITNGTMVDYAKKRIKDHIGRFTKLYYQIKSNRIDKDFLNDINKKDPIFPDIDYHIYTKLN